MSPLLIVSIDQVLNLESDPGLQCLILAVFEQVVANLISVVKVDDFIAPFLFILEVLFGLSAQVSHQLIHHVAHNLNVLVVLFLLEIVEACFYDVSVQLSCDIQLGNQVHVSVHLLFLTDLSLIVIIKMHHELTVLLILIFFFLLFSSNWDFCQTILSFFTVLTLLVKHFEELLLAF